MKTEVYSMWFNTENSYEKTIYKNPKPPKSFMRNFTYEYNQKWQKKEKHSGPEDYEKN